eukprot:5702068-Prymnesium_polylepis.1
MWIDGTTGGVSDRIKGFRHLGETGGGSSFTAGGCGSNRGLEEVASRRRLARLGALGACASGRAAQRPSEGLRGS